MKETIDDEKLLDKDYLKQKFFRSKGKQLQLFNQAMFLAAKTNNAELLGYIISLGAQPAEIKDSLSFTPLHVAAENNCLDCAIVLIENGSEVDHHGNAHRTPLFLAASMGHSAMVSFLLNKGANPNIVDTLEGNSPLHEAARGHFAEVCRLLIAYGADINGSDIYKVVTNKYTPLDYATKHKLDFSKGLTKPTQLPYTDEQMATVNLLLDAGAKLPLSERGQFSAEQIPNMRRLNYPEKLIEHLVNKL